MGDRLRIGSKVEKTNGYKWPGVVVSVFRTRAGHRRLVVECTVPEVAGALHIYSPKDVKLAGDQPMTRPTHDEREER